MYIRTKDGIYEVEKLNLNKIIGNIKYEIIGNKLLKTMYGYEAHLYENEILKQSDKLTDLCDGFYIDKCKEEFLYDEIFDECWYDFNLYFKECAKNSIDVYGFIKTDKGLIYVAKMDSEGKLCLI